MTERRMPGRLVDDLVELDAVVGDDAIWTAIVEIAEAMRIDEWALIGGQMVALHGFVAGAMPPRTSTDIDIVADVVVRRGALGRCVRALESLEFEARPSISGKTLHRFVGARCQVDLVVPDHVPPAVVERVRGLRPIPIAGGRRALDRAALATVSLGGRRADVVVPDLRGALVLKARAAAADSRDPERHLSDLAFLSSLVADPLEMAAALDAKERRSLRRVDLPVVANAAPWVFLAPDVRADAAETWHVLTSRG